MLEVKKISKTLDKFSLKDVSLEVMEGEYFVVLGQSGVGKSVLLETIAGLQAPDSGNIILNSKDITENKIQDRGVGLVYQDATLFPHLTVEHNISYPLNKLSKEGKKLRTQVLAEQVLAQNLLQRYPETLSGGEYQRVSLARTLASNPQVLLLDEPLSSLDVKAKADLRSLLRKINRNGLTVVHVTHDYEEAVSLASRIAVMEDGKIVQVDKPQEIFMHPKSEFVAKFIGIKNFIKGDLYDDNLEELKTFKSNGINISVLTDAALGSSFLLIDPNEITIAKEEGSTSARNKFKGVIKDIAPATLGVEITVDIGLELVVLVTRDAVESMHLDYENEIWVRFKASACKILNTF